MISSFFGQHRFLSNFFPCHIRMDSGKLFYSVEHAYQALKSPYEPIREVIRLCSTAGEAKEIGGHLPTLNPHFMASRLAIMRVLLLLKFTQEPQKSLLLKTYPHALCEGNNWHDNYWGACMCKGCTDNFLNPKHNHLGKLLEEVRTYLMEKRDAHPGR